MIYSQLSPKRVYFGKDSSEKLINIIRNNFKKNETLYFIDQNFFTKNTDKKVVSFLNGQKKNLFLLENKSEPKTNFVDNLMVKIKAKNKNISLVVGIGGGSTLDISKAVSNSCLFSCWHKPHLLRLTDIVFISTNETATL